jgi:hypothetical protein
MREYAAFVGHLSSMDSANLSIRDCLAFIAELAFASSHSGSAPVSTGPSAVILLGVDEISKSKWENDLLKLIGGISDSPLLLSNGMIVAVLPVVTSLSQSLVADQELLSNRPLRLISLPVHLPGAAAMMLKQLKLEPDFLPIMNVMCRSLGNHGRLLEVLLDLLKPNSVHFKQLVAERENAISPILRAVIADFRGSTYFDILKGRPKAMLIPICHALLGTSLGRDDRLEGCLWTPDQLQMNGVFIGDATSEKRKITPIISPLQLLLWAEQVISRMDFLELHPLANALTVVLSIEAPFTWVKFESFHAGVNDCACVLVIDHALSFMFSS